MDETTENINPIRITVTNSHKKDSYLRKKKYRYKRPRQEDKTAHRRLIHKHTKFRGSALTMERRLEKVDQIVFEKYCKSKGIEVKNEGKTPLEKLRMRQLRKESLQKLFPFQSPSTDNDIYASIEGKVIANPSLIRISNRIELGSKKFAKVDHAFVEKVSGDTEQYHSQKNLVKLAPDELLTTNFGYDLSDVQYLGREAIKNQTGIELPDADFVNVIRKYVENKIQDKISSKIPKDLQKDLFHRFLDESAVLAMAKIVENLVGQQVTLEVLEKNVGIEKKESSESLDLPNIIEEKFENEDDSLLDFEPHYQPVTIWERNKERDHELSKEVVNSQLSKLPTNLKKK